MPLVWSPVGTIGGLSISRGQTKYILPAPIRREAAEYITHRGLHIATCGVRDSVC